MEILKITFVICMLISSYISVKSNNSKEIIPFDFGFVSANNYIILESDIDSNIEVGKADFLKKYEYTRYTVTKNINLKLLNPQFKNLIGKKILICCEDGTIDTAEIVIIKVMAECIPHFGVIQDWSIPDEPVTEDQKAEQIWELGDHFIVAQFYTKKSLNSNVIFAVPLGNKIELYPVIKDFKDNYGLKDLYLKNLAQTDIFKSYQTEFSKIDNSKTNWWESEDSYSNYFFVKQNSDNMFAAAYITAGNPCGGEYFYETFSIAEFVKNKLISLPFLVKEDGYALILAADIDDDGSVEFILENGFGKRILIKQTQSADGKNKEFQIKYEWQIPYLDCPC